MAAMATTARPANVGVLAAEVYFPTRYVAQTSLEAADGCAGKYTVGLGQTAMAFCDDREDIGSVLLNALSGLLRKYGVPPSAVGRVEVGTETLLDKSKSVKTSLMALFGDNTDIEGVSSTNACYGGTAALFNSVAWVESAAWDGRFAVVLAGDIAVYDKGPARPTGGCGAVALLIGPDAPLALEPTRATHAMDCYDFYKPNHSEYATVDGALSQRAFLSSVDKCYDRVRTKTGAAATVTTDHFDWYCFHSPYNKLVQKGFARMALLDFAKDPANAKYDGVREAHAGVAPADTYEDKGVDAAFRKASKADFDAKVLPCCHLSRHVGNCYTASVFMNLAWLLHAQGEALAGKRVGVFSYGSGSVASLYSFVGRPGKSAMAALLGCGRDLSLANIAKTLDLEARLAARTEKTNDDFVAALDLRAACYGRPDHAPVGALDHIAPGAYYLEGVDALHRRTYAVKEE